MEHLSDCPNLRGTAAAAACPSSQSFFFGSYRSAADASGDFILLDGFNGGLANPYHTFDILDLRLRGRTILAGYHNQVLTSADGMVEPAVAMDAALRPQRCDRPDRHGRGRGARAPRICTWQRSLCLRTGRYAIVADDLTLRTDSENMQVATSGQRRPGAGIRRTRRSACRSTVRRFPWSSH